MESLVDSRISSKRYKASLNTVYEDDVGFKTHLYKVDIFGHNIVIAPGKVIYDNERGTDYVAYCYVYVIQEDKPVMKLGIYEEEYTKGNEVEVFDLEEFNEGSMLLFEYYDTNPNKIIEFETIEKTESIQKNAFDLILEKVYKPDSDIYNFYESRDKSGKNETGRIYTNKEFNSYRVQYKSLQSSNALSDKHVKMLKEILVGITKSLGSEKNTKIFNTETISFMKKYCGDTYDERFSICLSVLSGFLKVKFIVINSSGNIYTDVFGEHLSQLNPPTHTVILRNYELLFNESEQPHLSNNITQDMNESIQIFKNDDVPFYLTETDLNGPEQDNPTNIDGFEETAPEVDLDAINTTTTIKPTEPLSPIGTSLNGPPKISKPKQSIRFKKPNTSVNLNA